MTSAIQVAEIPALIQERLRQVRHQLFPQRLRLQIDDQGLSVQVLTKGKAPLPPPVQVPLPAGICRQGIPQNGAALGDFIGDWLLELGAAQIGIAQIGQHQIRVAELAAPAAA